MRLWHICALGFVALIAGAFIAGLSLVRDSSLQMQLVEQFWSPPPSPGGPDKIITVPSGANAAQIGDLLAQQGIVKEPQAFRFVAGRLGLGNNLQAGQYQLHGGMTLSQVAQALQHGRARVVTISVPEGKRLEEVLDTIASTKLAAASELAAVANPLTYSYGFLKELPPSATLEGYLFPDTYHASPDLSPKGAIELFLGNFDRKVTPELRAAARAQGLTLHQAIILASIIEREARLPQERATIAGVYLNRLREEMPLAADPTIQYVIALDAQARAASGWWKDGLTLDDLAVPSPYNTYMYPGLPPGPICNPGLAAIQAAVHPEQHDFLFFVARPDGSHAFARTYDEHQRNIFQYQQ